MKSLNSSLFQFRLKINENTRDRMGTDRMGTDRRPLVAKVTGFDADEVRRYFRGVESLSREASRAHDPRILDLALRVLMRQADTIRRDMMVRTTAPEAIR